MIRKVIEYVDLNGNKQTVEAHFHLNKAEIAELEVSEEGGLADAIERVVAEKDNRKILSIFKKLILVAYGMKSEDGQRFIKSPENTRKFEQSEAFAEYFIELATDSEAAAEFVNGVIPKTEKVN